jgi:hypothetical protein
MKRKIVEPRGFARTMDDLIAQRKILKEDLSAAEKKSLKEFTERVKGGYTAPGPKG